MAHESLPSVPSRHETRKKKRKLSTKQKIMGAGATIATGVALFGAGTIVGGSSERAQTPQGLEQVDLSKAEHGQERFKQILDPNEEHRLVSEGIDAPTTQEALQKLFNAMSHDYRVLDAYAKLTGAYFGLGPEVQSNPDNATLLLSEDGKTLSQNGKQILGFVEQVLTGTEVGSMTPEESYADGSTEKMLANGDATTEFVDMEDAIVNKNQGPLYITGMGKSGLVRNSQENTFGDDAKAISISFPATGNPLMHSEGGRSNIVIAVSGGQPVLDGYSQTDLVPEGLTEAQGHQPITPEYNGE